MALTDSRRSLVVRFKIRLALVEGRIDEARESVAAYMANPLNDRRMEEFHFPALAEHFDQPDQALSYLRQLDYTTMTGIGAQVFWPAYFGDYDLARTWMKEVMGRNDIFDDIDLYHR